MKQTFNPENWVHDELELTATDDTVTVRDVTLTLKVEPVQYDEEGNTDWDFYLIVLMHEGQKIGSMSKFGKDKEWELLGCGLERQHADSRVLAGIVIANLF